MTDLYYMFNSSAWALQFVLSIGILLVLVHLNTKTRSLTGATVQLVMSTADTNADRLAIYKHSIVVAQTFSLMAGTPIVRAIIQRAITGDHLAMQALTVCNSRLLRGAIRSAALFDRIGPRESSQWWMTKQSTPGTGAENAKKLFCFGLGLRPAHLLECEMSGAEQAAYSAVWQRLAPSGSL